MISDKTRMKTRIFLTVGSIVLTAFAGWILYDQIVTPKPGWELEGIWFLTSQEIGGVKTFPSNVEHGLVFNRGKYTAFGGGVKTVGTYKIDVKRSPNTIDIHFSTVDEFGVSKENSDVLLGIFELQGDCLKTCFGTTGPLSRSREFSSKPFRMLDTYERKKN